MTAAAAADTAPEAAEGWAPRALAALPLVTVFAWLALVYAWQAWLVTTPVIFTDELLYAELSRSFADTGHAALRGVPHSIQSLSIVVRAPAWLIDDVETAYLAAKLIGVLAMTAAAFPAYALARLLVSPRPALFAAAAAATIPALSYSALLLEEPVAYPVATLAFYLGVRALARPSPLAAGAAVAAALAAPLVRGELAVVPVVLLAAALVFAWKSDGVRRRRERLRPWDGVVATALVAPVLVGSHLLAVRLSAEWDIATDRPGAMLEHAVWAAGAFAIGVGVLPVVAALAALVRPAGAPRTPERRAFAAVFLAAIPAFLAYTAGKGAWLETVLELRILERNLIYLAPLVFVGTALWLERPRLRPLAVLGAALAVLPLLVSAPIELRYPYFEAPGYAPAAFANRELVLTAETIERLLLVLLALSVVVLLAARRLPAVATAAAIVALGWNVTGEVYAALGLRDFSERLEAGLPRPPDWVDRATGGEKAIYLGQQLTDPSALHSLEFWNRSLGLVWTLDYSVLEPGPTGFPVVDQATGQLVPDPAVPYAVVDPRIAIVGRELQRVGPFALVRVAHPLRLQESVTGVLGDGWMGTFSAYNRYWTPGTGIVEVDVGRLGASRNAEPAAVVVRVGALAPNEAGLPSVPAASAERQWTVRSGRQRTFRLRAPPAPFRVEVNVGGTFVPAELDPASGDTRELGAQVSFRFVPWEESVVPPTGPPP